MEYQLVPMTECGDTNKDGAVPTKTQENLPSNEITEHKKMLKNVWLPLLRILATANLVRASFLVLPAVSHTLDLSSLPPFESYFGNRIAYERCSNECFIMY